MIKRVLSSIVLLVILLVLVMSAVAQGDSERVTIETEDGQELVGTYFAPTVMDEDDQAYGSPAVLLLHHNGGQKEHFDDVVPVFLEAGYAALAVDFRGFGETGGRPNWAMGEADLGLWVAWLREQPGIDPERINFVGASLGGDVSLRVMATDEAIVSATVLSPGLDFEGVTTADAMEAIGTRPVFLVSGTQDQAGMEAILTFLKQEPLDLMIRLYDTGACCTWLFQLEDDLMPMLVEWLDLHN